MKSRVFGPIAIGEGESLDLELQQHKRAWDCGKRGWMVSGMKYADALDALDPPKDAYRLLNWMHRRLKLEDRNKITGWSMANIGQDLHTKLSRFRVSTMLKLLRQAGFIQTRNELATIYIHPQFMFRGGGPEQAQAMREWNAWAAAHPADEPPQRPRPRPAAKPARASVGPMVVEFPPAGD